MYVYGVRIIEIDSKANRASGWPKTTEIQEIEDKIKSTFPWTNYIPAIIKIFKF